MNAPRLVRTLCALALVLATSCTPTEKTKDVADAAQRRALLSNLAEHVVAKSYAAFRAEAEELSAAASKYATSLSESDRAAVRSAFSAAMLAWERAEVLQWGPAAPTIGKTPGAQSLRQQIYAWDQINHCGVDQALVAKSYETSFGDISATARGLGALELLLFDESTESGCTKANVIITSGDWQKLIDSDLAQRRAAFAKAAASDLVARAKELEQAFDGYRAELARAGDGSKLFEVTQDALNPLTDALFYIEKEVKDIKLALPLGLTERCMGAACYATVELRRSRLSTAAILANLEAFRDVFRGLPPGGERGGEMHGLKDLLLSVSDDALANEMDRQIDQSITAVKAIDGPLDEVLARGDKTPMQAYMVIQELSTNLKGELVARLKLRLPMSSASDND
jgi:predicted lipoprotein